MSLLGKIPYKNHGRRHRAGGSDPIPGVVYMDFANVGGWIKINTDGDGTPVADLGIWLEATNGQITLISDDLINLIAPQILAQVTESFAVRLEDDGALFQVDATGGGPPMLVIDYDTRSTGVHLKDNQATFDVFDSGGQSLFEVAEDGTAQFVLASSGSEWAVFSSSFDAIVTATASRRIGFFGSSPVAKQTGVAVTDAAIHAALVNYGLISA